MTVRRKARGEWLAVQEAADLLGIHVNTLTRWADAGIVPHYRHGPRRDRRFRAAELERFITRSRSGT